MEYDPYGEFGHVSSLVETTILTVWRQKYSRKLQMALIIPPAAGADSLCSVADADAYHAARGNAAWALLGTTAKEQALRRATDYLGGYAGSWKGVRTSSTQTLDWPRSGAVVNGYEIAGNIVPVAVANACAVLALKGSAGDLAPDQGPQKQSVKVGPIETTYAQGTRQGTKYSAVDSMLAPYLGAGAGQIKLVRA